MTQPILTHDAADPSFNYYGRWHHGCQTISINSGSLVEFAYTGETCVLVFDVTGFSHYPAILVQVDEEPVVKTTLSGEVSAIRVTPFYNTLPSGNPPFKMVSSGHHLVRFWAACHSLYQMETAGKQWTTLVGGCKFLGVNLDGGNMVSLPYVSQQIEFLGDSITQGGRLLYVGVDDDVELQMPHINWPQYVATMLGMKPIVTGFGGQGLSGPGTCGAPAANAAFPFIYDRIKWDPAVKPQIVVIYQGTNDSVSSLVFKELYSAYLQSIRMAYPAAALYAVCPHNTRYATAIQNAVDKMTDLKIRFLDYSTGVISANETCDSCHLNPGGAVRLATKLANDLKGAYEYLPLTLRSDSFRHLDRSG